MEKKFISIVAYLHNAENNIVNFLDTVIGVCQSNYEKLEVILVNDACEDGTMEQLRKYMENHPQNMMVNVVHMSCFQGLESAMNAGRDIAIGDFVYEFDDILVDYSPEVVLKAYQELIKGYDIVSVKSCGKNRLTSRMFYALFNKTSCGTAKIGPETFRIISRRAINRVRTIGQYIPYRKAMYMNCGLKATTIAYDSTNQNIRVKNSTIISERTDLAIDSFIYFTNALERISAIISGVFLLITILVGVYIIADFFSQDKIVEGWVSTMGFMAMGFFGVFVLLTIILKYLSVLINLIFKQQRYLVADIEKL